MTGRLARIASRWRLAAAILGAAGLLYAREVETRWVEVRPVKLVLPRLAPEFDGYRVVQFGDIHLDDWTKPERLHGIVRLVNAQRPDLIVITGTSRATPRVVSMRSGSSRGLAA